MVLLADVRSVGVQGDGRTYGHPIVLRPVSSEDAMTADWTRLPYDVLARISTRITNEVPEVNRVALDVTSKPPAPSSGSSRTADEGHLADGPGGRCGGAVRHVTLDRAVWAGTPSGRGQPAAEGRAEDGHARSTSTPRSAAPTPRKLGAGARHRGRVTRPRLPCSCCLDGAPGCDFPGVALPASIDTGLSRLAQG